jgi:hypothetical protein
MWMPGGVAYLVAALALTARWLTDAGGEAAPRASLGA